MVDIEAESTESYEIQAGHTNSGLLMLCDHASNHIPTEYARLGLPQSELERHIGYDIGAAGVTRAVATAFGAPAVLSRFSRLLIDPNRGEDDPTLIMKLSDGAIVPGNRYLDDAERERRLSRFYRPYHEAISKVIAGFTAVGRSPVIVSIHSFTPAWKGASRPWQVGILWDRDDRLARPIIRAFAADGDLTVGDNQPYKGSLEGDSMWRHATANGFQHALIEVRQDLIQHDRGQEEWGSRIISVLDELRVTSDLSVTAPGPRAPHASAKQNIATPAEAPA